MTFNPIKRVNARWWHVLNATTRLAILRGATRPFAENVIVNEYPKSGGSWLSQMISEALDLPFPRNRLPMLRSCVMQCHILNPAGMRNVVVVWRDGRDIAVSFYHFMLIGHEFGRPEDFQANAARLGISDPLDICGNLPKFIEGMMTGVIGPPFSWPDFVARWHGRNGVVETRYEDLLADPEGELYRILVTLLGTEPSADKIRRVVEKYSFRAQSGRHRGEEQKGSFLRKGIAGDWVNHFSPEAISIFNAYAGEALDTLRYDREPPR